MVGGGQYADMDTTPTAPRLASPTSGPTSGPAASPAAGATDRSYGQAFALVRTHCLRAGVHPDLARDLTRLAWTNGSGLTTDRLAEFFVWHLGAVPDHADRLSAGVLSITADRLAQRRLERRAAWRATAR